MKPNVLSGHSLPDEGRIGKWGNENGRGATRCLCGTRSPVLESTGSRKRWHRDHKDQIRADCATKETAQ